MDKQGKRVVVNTALAVVLHVLLAFVAFVLFKIPGVLVYLIVARAAESMLGAVFVGKLITAINTAMGKGEKQ